MTCLAKSKSHVDDEDEDDETAEDDAVIRHMMSKQRPRDSVNTSSRSTKPSVTKPVTRPAVQDPFKQGAAGLAADSGAAGSLPSAPGPPEPGPSYSQFKSGAKKLDKDFAKWSKHTNGMGMKLLAKMGWKPGQGLGVAQHGIARPIEVRMEGALWAVLWNI